MKKAKNKLMKTASNGNKAEKEKSRQSNSKLISEKIKELKFDISCHQKNIKLLFAFATGEKSSKHPRFKNYQRTENDDCQLLKTVACLRTQIMRKKQELAVLKEVSSDAVQ